VYRQAFEPGTCQIQLSNFTAKLIRLIHVVVLLFGSPEFAIEQLTRLLPIPTLLTRNGKRPSCQVEDFIVKFSLSRPNLEYFYKIFQDKSLPGHKKFIIQSLLLKRMQLTFTAWVESVSIRVDDCPSVHDVVFVNIHCSPFVSCFFYNKPKFKFIQRCNHSHNYRQ